MVTVHWMKGGHGGKDEESFAGAIRVIFAK